MGFQVLGFQVLWGSSVGGSRWDLFPWQQSPACLRALPSSPHWLCHAHPRGEAWSGEGGKQGPPRPGGHPPAPSHTRKHIPGDTQACSGQPQTAPPRVCWLPSAEDRPLGTSSQVHGILYSLRPPLFSLCSLRVTPTVELKSAGWQLQPCGSTRLQARSRPVQLTTQRNSWKPLTLCLCWPGASSKDHSLQAAVC